MPYPVPARPALSSAATLLLVACEPHRSAQPSELGRNRPTRYPPISHLRKPTAARASGPPHHRSASSAWRRRSCTTSASTSWAALRELPDRRERLQAVEQGGDRGEGRLDRRRVLRPAGRGPGARLPGVNGKTLAMLLDRPHDAGQPRARARRPAASSTTAAGSPRGFRSPTRASPPSPSTRCVT